MASAFIQRRRAGPVNLVVWSVTMKLYPLLLGRTKVPFGQFYGGLAGREHLGALFRFITDKKHFIWVPMHGHLLEHPKEGLVLVDVGICPAQVHQHSRYYRAILHFILETTSIRRSRMRRCQNS